MLTKSHFYSWQVKVASKPVNWWHSLPTPNMLGKGLFTQLYLLLICHWREVGAGMTYNTLWRGQCMLLFDVNELSSLPKNHILLTFQHMLIIITN